MSNRNNMPALLAIASRAVEVGDARRRRVAAKEALHKSYRNWKFANEIGYVERDTPEWNRMMADTKPAYQRFEKAKQDERNTSKRLDTAVRRFQASE